MRLSAWDLREQVGLDWLDYQHLVSLLGDYSKPRDRISAFLADGSLLRLRKGLYVFGERFRRWPISREALANLIYGPAYLSLDFVLSRYGLVPERVEEVTSVTSGEKKIFSTPLGVFSYWPLSLPRYRLGMDWKSQGDVNYLEATPEKALVDKFWQDKVWRFNPVSDYFWEDLRLDPERVAGLNRERLREIAEGYGCSKIERLIQSLLEGPPP